MCLRNVSSRGNSSSGGNSSSFNVSSKCVFASSFTYPPWQKCVFEMCLRLRAEKCVHQCAHNAEIVQSHNQHYSTSDPTPSSIFKRQLEQLRWMLLQHPATSWPFQLVLPTPGRQKELPHGISQNCGTHDDMSLSNRWRIHLFPLWVSGGTGQQVDTITIMRTGRTLNHKVAHAVQDFGSSWPCGIFHAIDIQ